MSWNFPMDDQLVGSSSSITNLLSSSGSKREFDSADDGDVFESTVKKICLNYEDGGVHMPPLPPPTSVMPKEEPKPYPFYFYKDFAKEEDPDPLTPLTPPGRVPNFPAKVHSMLARQDLSDIIAWMPHGRSWRVLKPREFEVRVIPTYFEHAKFSSFIRQANGWGFRRITQGRDRNSYYHPLFLRGLPHLCKRMKRPGVSQKQTSDPDHEPDLYKISEASPVPEKSDDDMMLLHCTIQGGPKARVPVQSRSAPRSSRQAWGSPPIGAPPPAPPAAAATAPVTTSAPTPVFTPNDQQSLEAFQQSLGASETQVSQAHKKAEENTSSQTATPAEVSMPSFPPMNMPMPSPFQMPNLDQGNPLAIANQLAFAGTGKPPAIPKEFQGDAQAASQFAAGFAAATALSHQQFQTMLASLGASMSFFQQHQQQQQQQNQAQPENAAASAEAPTPENNGIGLDSSQNSHQTNGMHMYNPETHAPQMQNSETHAPHMLNPDAYEPIPHQPHAPGPSYAPPPNNHSHPAPQSYTHPQHDHTAQPH